MISKARVWLVPLWSWHTNEWVSDIVNVDLEERSYPIYIGQGIINGSEQLRKHVTSKKAMIVTNTKVGPLYSAKVRSVLEKQGTQVYEIVYRMERNIRTWMSL